LAVTRTQPTGNGPGDEFLAVMTRNGKGDIIERLLDGDKVVWVDECSNVAAVVSPVLDDIGSEPCSTPDSSFYTYEADGKISTIFDAIATNANDNFDDVNRFLRYKYDTLGRVISIEDPNYDGALSTKITFDEIGNLHTTTNARGQTRTSEYDALGRLKSISSDVAGEETFSVSYRNYDENGVTELQAGREWSDYYSRKYVYDDLGRLRRNELKVDVGGAWTTFLTDYEFDQAGRPLQITYPDKSTQIAYEYDKGYLKRVCDLGAASDCTEADGATNYVDGVVYDELGRREEVSWTGGARSFAYSGTTHRLSEDHFEGNGPSAYLFERNIAEYDAVGNIKVVTGLSSMPDVAVGESYDYDNRNRLIKWTKDEVSGATVQDYGYDDLGNLVDHAGDTQSFTQAEFPHAIASRNAEATSYAYDPDGNVQSILAPGTNRYFNFNSANQLACIGSSESSPGVSSCDQNVFRYDIQGKRLIDHRPLGSLNYQVFVDDSYSYVRYPAVISATVEIFAFGERIANKEIPSASLRSASLWPIGIGPGFLTGASAVLGFWLLSWAWDRGMLILVVRQPVRGAVALSVTLSLFFYVPVAWAGGWGGAVPIHRWELSNAVGTGMVLLDQTGERIRTTFRTPFGREHQVAGSMFGLRKFYGGHRVHDSSGLVYMNARWMDPGSGTFVSVDPLHLRRNEQRTSRSGLAHHGQASRMSGARSRLGANYSGTDTGSISLMSVIHNPQYLNGYSYAVNNPISAVDPTGEVAFFVPVAIIVVSAATGAGISVFAGGDPVMGGVVAGAGAALGVAVSAVVAGTALTGAAAVGARAVGNAVAGGALSGGVQAGSNVASGAPAGEGVAGAVASGALLSAAGSVVGDALEAGFTAMPGVAAGLGAAGESTGIGAAMGASAGNTVAGGIGVAVDAMGSSGSGGAGAAGEVSGTAAPTGVPVSDHQ
jgi:YD repeat-containing protein